jgi:transposase
MPRQYSHQFRERVLSLLDEGRRVDDLAKDLGVSAATIYKWRRQASVDAGEAPGTTSAEAAELVDAKRRIHQLEEELRATRLAASMLKDQGIRPKGGSRSSKP